MCGSLGFKYQEKQVCEIGLMTEVSQMYWFDLMVVEQTVAQSAVMEMIFVAKKNINIKDIHP